MAQKRNHALIVAINLLTAEHVVGAQSPIAIDIYRDTFGRQTQLNMWLQPIYPRDTRPSHAQIAEMEAWLRQRASNRRA